MTPTSLVLHYYSQRQGLSPWVEGMLNELATTMFGVQISIEAMRSRKQGTSDHEVCAGSSVVPACPLIVPAGGQYYAVCTHKQGTTGHKVNMHSCSNVSCREGSRPYSHAVQSAALTGCMHVLRFGVGRSPSLSGRRTGEREIGQ